MNNTDKKLFKILGEKNYKVIKDYPLFYKKVWLKVLEIPKGEVRTYKWVAQSIGHPRAYRAVGKALKENPLTVIIPCHRVIKASGELGGYSKGIEHKYELLKKENMNFTKILKRP
ncbi:MAG: MGMT family protein [Elusimicrobiota bacterium]|nr:MGMT family protein [Endomicrobiia bacterium]MDW8165245.1 MGMT family protein [Elusimicrobiota bacterium]